MTKSKVITPPPAEVTGAEPNDFLARFKASLAKRWSYTRMEPLFEIAQLVAFLHVLDRDREALAVASTVATAVPGLPPWPGGGMNYNVWSPATRCHAFIVRANPPALADQVAASRKALLEDPGILRTSTDYIADLMPRALREADAPPETKPTKGQRQNVAMHLGTAVLVSVLAHAGDAAFAPHAQAADEAITRLRSKLRLMLVDRKTGPAATKDE
jgi:hypothetical protein